MEQEHEPEPRPRLDRQAALEELERFGRDIQRYRAQREAVGDAFESFVRSFKTPQDDRGVSDQPAAVVAATPERVAKPPVVTPPPVVTAAPVVTAPPVVIATQVANEDVPSIFETPVTEVSPPAMAAPPPLEAPVARGRSSAAMAPLATAAVAVVLGGGLLAAVLWNRSPATSSSPVAPAESAAPAPEPAAAPPQAAAPVAATPAPAPVVPAGGSELVAERKVWIRVIADGEKVLEREVPAGTRIPIKAEKTIVIRTGDAGAVRLSIRGFARVLLGREGEVVTRSFSVPPGPAGAR